MKKIPVSLLIAGAACALPLAATAQIVAEPYAKWDFTLASNYEKGLTEVTATGSTGAGQSFNRDLGSGSVVEYSPDKYAYRIKGNGGASNGGALTGISVRESFSLVVDIASWDLVAATGTSTLLNIETRFSLSGGYPLGQFALVRKSDGSIDLATYGALNIGSNTSQWLYAGLSLSNQMGPITIDLFYDMASSMMTLSYSVDGGSTWNTALTANQFTAPISGNARIPAAVYMVQQSRMADGTYIDINSISLVPVPEPATYALAIGTLALVGTVASRRRKAKRS